MIHIPREINYIGAFLTFDCDLHCSYCINRHTKLKRVDPMSGDEWVAALNMLEARPDLPITLQGGEPTAHPEFYELVNGVIAKPMDLLTNLDVDIEEFIDNIHSTKFNRNAPYPSIRVSYHPETMGIRATLLKILSLQNLGYQVGLFMVEHPKYKDTMHVLRLACQEVGVDFRTKEFLGMHENKLYGTYAYKDCVHGYPLKQVACRTTELLIAPNGYVYKCHADLYAGEHNIGHILDPDFEVIRMYRPCYKYGECSPCDTKIKTNRYQQYGHTSVEIIDTKEKL